VLRALAAAQARRTATWVGTLHAADIVRQRNRDLTRQINAPTARP
jgi:hypothetical protein